MSEEATEDAIDPRMLSHPQEGFKMLRDLAPVTHISSPTRDVTIVGKHEDILTVLRTPEIFSSGPGAVNIGQIRPLIPLSIDPPEHSKFRKILDPLFAPRRVAALEDQTRQIVRNLIAPLASSGGCNFDSAVAEPFPSTVFLQLLGLPLDRLQEFLELKDGILRPDAASIEERDQMVDATGLKIYAVLQDVIDARSAKREHDFISGFLDAEVDGVRLTTNDVIDICYLFFLAGLDTVAASLDCMLAFLAQNPTHRQRLVDHPGDIPGAVEEMLRWESPVTGVARITTRDTELGGCPIAKGTMVSPMLGSANTDERFWDDPDTVDFGRESNKHIAFGAGTHRCLGSHLARMELRVALEEWHKAVPDYQLADGVELLYSQGLRQISNLQLVW